MCGGKTKKTTTQQTTAPAPEAMEYYKLLMNKLKGVGKLGYTPYKGERVAGFTPDQLEAMQGIRDLQGAGMGTLQQAIRSAERGAAPITAEDIQRYQDPYQKNVVDAMTAMMRQQEAEDISKLSGQSISAGAFGGDRAKMAQAQMMRNQAQERNLRVSDLMSKGYSQSLAAAQADREAAARGSAQFSSLAGQEYSLPAQQLQALYGMGTAQQALRQARLDIPYQTYLERRAFPYQQLQYMAGVGTGVGSQMGGTSSGETRQPGPSPFSQILGAGLSLGLAPVTGGGSLFGNFMASDERVKENIEDVGVTNDGQTIYKYNYKGDPRTHMGLLAQEVEQTHPEAVGNIAGFKVVNYDLATKDAVHKADGGGLIDPFSGQTGMFGKGFIPAAQMARGQGAPGFTSAPAAEGGQENSLESIVDQAVSLAGKMKEARDFENPASWKTTTTMSSENPAAWSPTVTTDYAANAFKLNPYQPFADGGEVSDRISGLSSIAKKLLEEKSPTETAVTESKLPEIKVPTDSETKPSVIDTPYKGSDAGAKKGSSLLGGLLGLSPEAEQAGFAAGLAMMAGESPFALSNIGAGGASGLKYYNELMKAKQQEAEKTRELDIKQMEVQRKASEKNLIPSGMRTEEGDVVSMDKETGDYYVRGKPLSPDTPLISETEFKKKKESEIKTTAALPKSKAAISVQMYENQRTKDDINKIISKVGYLTTGFLGTPLSKIPGTEAADVAAAIKSIQARLGFEQLQTMRQNSPTGGALGNVSNQEIAYLQSAVQSLSQEQSPEQLKENLKAISDHINRIEQIQQQSFKEQYPEEELPTLPEPVAGPTTEHPSVSTKEQFDALPSGAVFFNVRTNRVERKP